MELEAQRAEAAAGRTALASQVAELTTGLRSYTGQTTALVNDLSAAEDQAAMLSRQRDEALRSRDFTARLVGELEYRLATLQSSQQSLVERLLQRTQESVTQVEAMIEITGLDINLLVNASQTAQGALGGPMVPAVGTPGIDGAFAETVFGVETQLDRWNALETVLGVLPLISPADSYYVARASACAATPSTASGPCTRASIWRDSSKAPCMRRRREW